MSHRIEKINELLKQQLSLLIHQEFGPELGIITVQAVASASDLQSAKVYISLLKEKDNLAILDKLQKRAYFFQQQLAKKMTIRFIPKLEFMTDHGQNYINKVEELLKKIEGES